MIQRKRDRSVGSVGAMCFARCTELQGGRLSRYRARPSEECEAIRLARADKGVGPDDVAVLAEALKVNKSLKSLDLACTCGLGSNYYHHHGGCQDGSSNRLLDAVATGLKSFMMLNDASKPTRHVALCLYQHALEKGAALLRAYRVLVHHEGGRDCMGVRVLVSLCVGRGHADNKLGADAMAALWEALKVNTSITNLVVIGAHGLACVQYQHSAVGIVAAELTSLALG
eukprot:1415316-Pleurochrysis_carterae.AAC.2